MGTDAITGSDREVCVDPLAWEDPQAWGEALAEAYRVIARDVMGPLPIFNHALEVEAVGFRLFNGAVMGIMITPWFLNVVLASDVIARKPPGSLVRAAFPVGGLDLIVAEVASIGRIAACSLFSPMSDFADMDCARAAAVAASGALMKKAADSAAEVAPQRPISRRNFLRAEIARPMGQG